MMQSWLLTEKKNMVNKILIDTNVLLDYLLMREPFYKDAEKIVYDCVEGKVKDALLLILLQTCSSY